MVDGMVLKVPPARELPPASGVGWGTLSAMTRRPTALNAAVSAQMSRMPRTRTKPEMSVRRELHRRGLRFRVNHPGLPGRPDIAFTRARLAVFVDGCFWHLCPQHAVLPKNNATWWREKLQRNVQRDREKDEALAALGWTVLHVWEHEDPVAVAEIVEQLWRARCRSDATAWPVT
ncbi:very short patch repair endonuclease [Micromonospora sp. DT41]|uniref:very short patch repair endonuclease n=1 Tax=Micromonospora sp. DT41 TaxID=3393437 RepID=UPI003CECEAAD